MVAMLSTAGGSRPGGVGAVGFVGCPSVGFAVSAPDCPPCFAASLLYGARGAAEGKGRRSSVGQFPAVAAVFLAGGLRCGRGLWRFSCRGGSCCPLRRGRWVLGACGAPVRGVPVRGRRVGGAVVRVQGYLARVGPVGWLWPRRPRGGDGGAVGWCVSRWCPALPLPGGGSTIGAGGLSFRVRYGSGRFPAPLWPPGWGWGCGGPGWPGLPSRVGGVGGLVLGCVVDAAGSPRPPLCGGGVRGGGSCRPISTGRLSPLPGLHLRPIDPVVHWGPSTAPRGGPCGDLVLEVVSRLDAFSGYPSRTWPTSGAPGGTTGAPGVRPSRSSRTGDGSPRVSCARRG